MNIHVSDSSGGGGSGALTSWRPSAQLPAVERYGRFEILGRVGRGGMAEILLARERSIAGTTRHLVIKRVLPEIVDNDEMLHMFLDEARVVMGLSHPNLCQIYDVGEHAGTWFIAMEWVHGITLHQLVRRAFADDDSVDFAIMARIVSQCAEALHHAHTARDPEGGALNLVHRDVSPHNIMVAYDGRVKLLDFGIAKTAASTHQTEAGVVKGKICYMAPEQWTSGPLDARTDVFALGACLYEALTGRTVFRRDSQMEVMKAVLTNDVPPLRDLVPSAPEPLVQIVHRALAVRAEDRFQTAREMSEALERFLANFAEPQTSARVADYTRMLFRAEVELGPVLERSIHGAHIAAPPPVPAILPPLPPGLLGHRAAPAALPLPVPPQFTALPPPAPARPPVFLGGDVGRSIEHEVAQELELSESYSVRPLRADPDLEPGEEGEEPREGPATFSEAPTAPLMAALNARVRQEELGRPLARTLSIPVVESARRIARIVLPAAAALLLGTYATLTYEGPVPRGASLPAQSSPRPVMSPPPAAVVAAEQLDMPSPTPQPSVPLSPKIRRDAAPREPSTAEALEGRLSINTRPWSTVYLGKKALGTTPLADVPVPSGVLTLKLVDRDGRVHVRRLEKGAARTAFFDFERNPE